MSDTPQDDPDRQENPNSENEIFSGPEILERISEKKLRKFAKHLSDSVYEAPDIVGQRVRMRLREALDPLDGIIERVSAQTHERFRRAKDNLHPSNTKKQEENAYLERIKKNIIAGNAFILLANGEPASLVSIEKYRLKMKDGRDAYEIGTLATLPSFEGHGYSKQIRELALQEIRQRHPDSPVMSITKNEKVKASFRKLGWKELDWRGVDEKFARREEFLARGFSEERIAEFNASWDREGYRLFLFDPREQIEH